MNDDGDGAICPVCIEHNFQESFALGKSKGKNPRGSNNKQMACDNCGSFDHLWRQCDAPNVEQYKRQRMASMGEGAGGGYVSVPVPEISAPLPAALRSIGAAASTSYSPTV